MQNRMLLLEHNKDLIKTEGLKYALGEPVINKYI